MYSIFKSIVRLPPPPRRESPARYSHGRTAAGMAMEGGSKDWQMDNAGVEAATAGGAAEDGPGAAAEAGTEEASGVTTATGKIPMPVNWGSMTKTPRRN